MTHVPGSPMAFDPPGDWKRTDRVSCRKCGAHPVLYRTHKSSCGGYEDDEFHCEGCGHTWWVDGIDS